MLLANRNENNRSSFNFGKFQRCFRGVAGGGAAPAVLGLPPFVLCHHLQQVGSEHGLNFEDELRVSPTCRGGTSTSRSQLHYF